MSGVLELRRVKAARPARVVATAAAAVVLVAALLPSLLVGGGGAASRGGLAARDAHSFLAAYVEPNGRVVRRDQGGDTVSEGQAYALLLAQSVGDGATYARVWRWTEAHLQRPDGLFAYLAGPGGRVRDPMPAADADVLIAWSLARASGPGARGYHAAARRVAGAVLRLETARRGRMPMLAAGPWATGAPVSIDPSYWAPQAFGALARLTGDRRWIQLAESSLALAASLTHGGSLLPPDWARVDGTSARPTPAPNGEAPAAQYGLNAQRLVVWLASGCGPTARRLAARWAPALSSPQRAAAIALSLQGSVIDARSNAMPLVAAAAAAQAAADPARRDQLLARAEAQQNAHPTYYGAAWLALGRTLLGTPAMGACAADGSGV